MVSRATWNRIAIGGILLVVVTGIYCLWRSKSVSVIAQEKADAHNDWGPGQVAQSFTVAEDRSIIGAQVLTQVRGNGTRSIRLNLQHEGEKNEVSPEILASGESELCPVEPDFRWRTIWFSPPYRASAGERLCVVLGETPKQSVPHAWHELAFSSSEAYPNGRLFRPPSILEKEMAAANARSGLIVLPGNKRDENANRDLAFAILSQPVNFQERLKGVFDRRTGQGPKPKAVAQQPLRMTPQPAPTAVPSRLVQSDVSPTKEVSPSASEPITVLYSRPVNGETGVPPDKVLVIGFDRKAGMSFPTVQVTDRISGTPVAGNVQLLSDGRTMAFISKSPYEPSRIYDCAVLSAGSTGDVLTPYKFSFKTFTRKASVPYMMYHRPDQGYIDVEPSASIKINWSEPLDEASLNGAFSLKDEQNTEVPLKVQNDPFWHRVTLIPTIPMEMGKTYEVTVRAQITNLRWEKMERDVVWKFETLKPEPVPPTGTPYVVESVPKPRYVNVARNIAIRLTWNEPMNVSTLTEENVRLVVGRNGKVTAASVTYDPATRQLEIRPQDPLAADTAYRVKVSDRVSSESGGFFGMAEKWQLKFRTASDQPARGPYYGNPGPGGP